MNLSDFQWHKAKSLINRREELASCIGPDGKIYAIGGYGGTNNKSCMNSVERYDPNTDTWELLANLNEGRRALSIISLESSYSIYAIGGMNVKDCISSVEKYDIKSNTWTVVGNLTSPKCTI